MTVVYDIETLKGAFTYSDINIHTQEIKQFVIHKDRDDRNELLDHLKKIKWAIGFNNINFDYPILHYFMKLNLSSFNSEELIKKLYIKAQEIIQSQSEDNFTKIVAIKQKDQLIKQIDLFKLWHFNNKARRTSLKSLEVSMNYPNVMEMPILHDRNDIQYEEIESILEYNLNDVLATYEFYKKSKEKIDLRKDLIKKYNIPCINFSDSKIGEQLVLKLYCNATGEKYYDVKEKRTYRHNIPVKNCILKEPQFNNEKFNLLLNKFKTLTVETTKGDIKESIIYKGFKYDLASGGIHGCIKPGVYSEDSNYKIIDLDVASLYPSIAVTNKLYPQHLGSAFCDVYEGILKERIKAKSEGNSSISDALKLSLNSVYGKSNDINSFLYDPLYTLKTTITGQLFLLYLAEKLVDSISDLLMLQINTDGLTIKIHKKYEDIVYKISKEWEDFTNLKLEFAYYSKMWIVDVNNYGATDGNKIKNKGRFEVDKVVGNEPAYHKDNSFRVIPLALQRYFADNIPVEQTILNHRDIYDFCGRQKFTKDSYGDIVYIDYDKNNNPFQKIEKQQRVTRYYISNNGSTFIKRYTKGTSEFINKGFQVTIFNKFIEKPFEEYSIDYDFYIKECYKVIDVIEPKQLNLF